MKRVVDKIGFMKVVWMLILISSDNYQSNIKCLLTHQNAD
jgi:hypothetical protein